MVFYYTIRGGPCLGSHSHITLAPSDIVCYVGRDKHENEHLIQYGWPGDIWFHVDGLSSAHVYFRLRNVEEVSSIPIDELPTDSVYDMMQICKNNSIAGCKLASVKMVYTPHSNLKKTFDMESGAVTYHDTKLCRYGRCEKDRKRVRELEKTKSGDVEVDYYQEMKDNERRIIERKKRIRKAALNGDANTGGGMYDPMLEDLRAAKARAGRQGDKDSGLDAGLEALEGLSLAATTPPSMTEEARQPSQKDNRPLWVREENWRRGEPVADVRFLRERGYSSSDATAACSTTLTRAAALKKLYDAAGDDGASETADPPADDARGEEAARQAREEEKEVLLAMFGFADEDDDAAARFRDADDGTSLDVALPVGGYEPPGRYGAPPPLMLEVYVDDGAAPTYPLGGAPVLAVVGGGLPERRLRELTDRVRAEARRRAEEEPGEPQIFNLLAFAGEAAESVVREETSELEEERKRALAEEKAAAAAARREAREEESQSDGATFTSEAARRAYARKVAAGAGGDGRYKEKAAAPRPRHNAKAGVSNQTLFDELFA